ncbi:MAG: helix-turn-helix transcriptional regulator [Bacteroidota bacterium]
MLFAVGLGINVFAIVQLVRKEHPPNPPARFGLAIVTLWALRFFFFYTKFEPWALDYPIFVVVDQNFFLLDPVLLWMYARSIIRPFKWNWLTLLHFVPASIGLFSGIRSAILYPAEVIDQFNQSVNGMMENDPLISTGITIIISVMLLISVFYFIRSVLEVKNYDASLKDNYSNIENLKVSWVVSFQRLWIVLFLLPVLLYFANYIYSAIDIMVTVSVLMTSLVLLSVFFNSNLMNQSYVTNVIPKKKSIEQAPSEVSQDDRALIEKLMNNLSSERYYEDEQISLDQLAEYVHLKPSELTELIKKSEYDNFYDLINSFRIDAVKRSLAETTEQIIVIAYQCGFNSKSAFNKIFKEKTGLTPREYRLSLK